MSQKCVNNNWCCLHAYLITSVPIMRHDINKKNYFNISNKNRIMKKIVDFCCSVELKNKAHSFSADNKWCTNTMKTWHNSETKCHLSMTFCADAYFYETLSLKINWTPDRAFLIFSRYEKLLYFSLLISFKNPWLAIKFFAWCLITFLSFLMKKTSLDL